MDIDNQFQPENDEFKKLEREDEENVVDQRILAIIGMLIPPFRVHLYSTGMGLAFAFKSMIKLFPSSTDQRKFI